MSETKAERLEREHEQLFHELRSIIPATEVQFAFLLTVAFSNRFDELRGYLRTIYFVTFVMAGLSLVLLLAPSAFHRVRFRQRDKEVMMRFANVEVIAAMAMVSLSITGCVFLIADLLLPLVAAIVVSVALLAVTTVLWWGLPILRRMEDDDIDD
jgi:uncharacterized membrane protein YphA (DoxX/SURF4 family)